MKGRFLIGSLLAVAIAGLVSCADDGVPSIDCSKVTPPPYSKLTIIPKCVNCHAASRTGDARHDATTGIDFDSYAAAVENAHEGQEDVAGVGDNPMPPPAGDETVDGGGPPPVLTAEDKSDFYAWVQCGEPE